MKYQLLSTLLPLVVVFNLFSNQQSQAEPSQIFQPIIKEIKTRLPSNLEMRLPASIPTINGNSTFYSFLPDDDSKLVFEFDELKMEFFTVLITDTSDCSKQKNLEDCLIAAVGVTEDPIESTAELNILLSDSDEGDVATVQLREKIPGYYFVNGELQTIIWRQEKMAHLLMSKKCDRDCMSKQQLIDMAKSAVSETTITNQNISYSSTAE